MNCVHTTRMYSKNTTTTKPVFSSRFKHFIQNIALLAISVLFVLIALEIFLRSRDARRGEAFLHAQQELKRENEFVFFEYDRRMGWKNKPLSEGPFTSPGAKIHVRINERGLRDRDYSYEKPAGVFRILVLGDSFTWGYGVEQTDIFTEKLEAQFGGRVEVINAGVSGYGTDQELIFLAREGLRYRPDLILVALSQNDFLFDNKASQHGAYPKPYFLFQNGKLVAQNYPLPDIDADRWQEWMNTWHPHEKQRSKKGFKGFLKTKTRVYPYLSEALKKLRYSFLRALKLHPLTAKVFDGWRLNFADREEGVLITEEIFRRMKRLTESRKAGLSVLVIPYRTDLEKLPNPFIAEFQRFFRAHGMASFYPYEAFLGAFKKGNVLYLSGDDHWNAAGHELAARELYRFLTAKQPPANVPAREDPLLK